MITSIEVEDLHYRIRGAGWELRFYFDGERLFATNYEWWTDASGRQPQISYQEISQAVTQIVGIPIEAKRGEYPFVLVPASKLDFDYCSSK